MNSRDGTGGVQGRRAWLVAAATVLAVALVAVVVGCGTAQQQAEPQQPAAAAQPEAAGEASAEATEAAAQVALLSTEEELAQAREAYAKATPQESGTCYDCHTSADALTAAATSEGFELAHFLVDESFATSTHGMLGCTFCHGGHADQAEASAAMADMIARPTKDGGVGACGGCHTSVVQKYQTSLHNTTIGIKNAWEARLASSSEKVGADLANQYYHNNGYEGACIDCHATCGECHVRSAEDLIDPNTGFTNGHNFVTLSSNEEVTYTCGSCHAGSIAACFAEQDVHGPSGAGMTCMDCHNVNELHGDGVERTTMAHSGAITTECEDCHEQSSLSGEWHSSTHLGVNDCWACHSGEYRTCENCHGWMAETRNDAPILMHGDCYLGYDPHEKKITTLVKAPVDAGMLGDGTDLLLDDADLNNGTTWYCGFTHSVILPQLEQSFCDRCHGEGTDLLKEADLQYPDYEAQQMVGTLPTVNVADYK